MYKIFRKEIFLPSEGFEGREDSELVDSFSTRLRAESYIDKESEKWIKFDRSSVIKNEDSFIHHGYVYDHTSQARREHELSYWIEECNTVKNGEKEVDVSGLKFDFIDDFHYGRAIVKKNGEYGIIDESFRIILPINEYTDIRPYTTFDSIDTKYNTCREPLAIVVLIDEKSNDTAIRFVDIHGNFLVKAEGYFHRIPSDRTPFFWAYDSETNWVKIQMWSPKEQEECETEGTVGGYTFYDVARRVFMKYGDYVGPEYDQDWDGCETCEAVDGFEGDVVRFVLGSNPYLGGVRYGLIDCNEKILVPPKYTLLLPFSCGFAAFRTQAEYRKKIVDEDEFDMIPIGQGYKWGFIDKSGKEVIAAKYEMVRPFCGGHAAFNTGGRMRMSDFNREESSCFFAPHEYIVGGKWGFIDVEGKEVVTAEYDYVTPFKCGMVAVIWKGGKGGFIHADLSHRTELIFDHVWFPKIEQKLTPTFWAYTLKEYDVEWGQNIYIRHEVYFDESLDDFIINEIEDFVLEENLNKW